MTSTIKENFIVLLGMILLCSFIFILSGCGGGGTATQQTTTNQPSISLDTSIGSIADGAIGTSRAPNIILKFSEAMDHSSINSSVFLSTSKSMTESVAISSLICNEDDTVFTFSPTSTLTPNTKYYVVVKSGAKTTKGKAVTGQFSFTTGTQDTPMVSLFSSPKITSSMPVLQVHFSEPVSNANELSIVLRESSPDGQIVALTPWIPGSSNTYSAIPESSISLDKAYYLTIGAKSNFPITNGIGTQITPVKFSVTSQTITNTITAAEAVNAPKFNYELTMIDPVNNQQNIPWPKADIIISTNLKVWGYNKNTDIWVIQRGNTINAKNNQVVGLDPIPQYVFDSRIQRYILRVDNLSPNNEYEIIINDSHNIQEHKYTFDINAIGESFTHVNLDINGQTGVLVDNQPVLRFINQVANVNSDTIKLHQGSQHGPLVKIELVDISANESSAAWQIRSLNPLQQNVIYYVEVLDGVLTHNGTPVSPAIFYFTTGDNAYMSTKGLYSSVEKCGVRMNGELGSCKKQTAYSDSGASGPRGITLNKSGMIAYIANYQSEDISICSIDAATGNFTNCSSGGDGLGGPIGVTLNSDDSMAYVIDQDFGRSIYSCPIDKAGNIYDCNKLNLSLRNGTTLYDVGVGSLMDNKIYMPVYWDDGDHLAGSFLAICPLSFLFGTTIDCSSYINLGIAGVPSNITLNADKTMAYITSDSGDIALCSNLNVSPRCRKVATLPNGLKGIALHEDVYGYFITMISASKDMFTTCQLNNVTGLFNENDCIMSFGYGNGYPLFPSPYGIAFDN